MILLKKKIHLFLLEKWLSGLKRWFAKSIMFTLSRVQIPSSLLLLVKNSLNLRPIKAINVKPQASFWAYNSVG
jgi:hypothetical protein